MEGKGRTFNLIRIRRARIMRVYLLSRRALVKRDEAVQEVVACHVVVVPAHIIREVVAQWGVGEFLREEVDLV